MRFLEENLEDLAKLRDHILASRNLVPWQKRLEDDFAIFCSCSTWFYKAKTDEPWWIKSCSSSPGPWHISFSILWGGLAHAWRLRAALVFGGNCHGILAAGEGCHYHWTKHLGQNTHSFGAELRPLNRTGTLHLGWWIQMIGAVTWLASLPVAFCPWVGSRCKRAPNSKIDGSWKWAPPTGKGPAILATYQTDGVTLCETQVLVEIQKPDMKFEYPDEDIRTAVQLSNAHQVRQVIPTSPQEFICDLCDGRLFSETDAWHDRFCGGARKPTNPAAAYVRQWLDPFTIIIYIMFASD